MVIAFHAKAEWIQRADFGAEGRHRAVGIGIGGKGYFGLGHYNGAGPNIVKNDWWEYDPATNAWTQKANYPGGFGQGSYGCLSWGMEEFGFVGGGQTSNGAEIYKYTPSSNSWVAVANMPTVAMNLQGFAIDNIGYYLQGNIVYAYDAVSGTWSIKNNAPFSSNIWNSAFVIDNKGYVKSGSNLWEYKPTIDQWIQRANFPGLATNGSMAFSQRNKGYIVTGYAWALSEVNSEVWEFDQASNTWNLLEEFPGTSRRFGSSFQIGDRCYVGLGTNGTNFNDLWEFQRFWNVHEENTDLIAIGPNPADNYFQVSSTNKDEFSLVIYDINGRNILQHTSFLGNCFVESSQLNPGQYYLRVHFKNGRMSAKTILLQ
jgi:N-acetylneuraminic acid mutarotase